MWKILHNKHYKWNSVTFETIRFFIIFDKIITIWCKDLMDSETFYTFPYYLTMRLSSKPPTHWFFNQSNVAYSSFCQEKSSDVIVCINQESLRLNGRLGWWMRRTKTGLCNQMFLCLNVTTNRNVDKSYGYIILKTFGNTSRHVCRGVGPDQGPFSPSALLVLTLVLQVWYTGLINSLTTTSSHLINCHYNLLFWLISWSPAVHSHWSRR